MRWIKPLVLAAVVALIATGCLRFDVSIEVADDGSATVDMISAVNAEVVTSVVGEFEELGISEDDVGTPGDICDGFIQDNETGDLPPGATVSDYDQDGFCGMQIVASIQASNDLSEQLRFVFDDDISLFRDESTGNWIFDAPIDTGDATDNTSGLPDAFSEALLGDASITIVIDLPGSAIEGQTNATTVGDNGRFEWNLNLFNPPERIFAQTQPGGGGGSPIALILGLLLLLGALAIGLWWFMTERNKSSVAMTDEAPDGVSDPVLVSSFQPAPVHAAPVAAAPVHAAPVAAAPVQAAPVAAAPVHAAPVAAAPVQAAPVAAAPVQAPQANTPVFDEALNAWVFDDPVRGKLMHDTTSDSWIPA